MSKRKAPGRSQGRFLFRTSRQDLGRTAGLWRVGTHPSPFFSGTEAVAGPELIHRDASRRDRPAYFNPRPLVRKGLEDKRSGIRLTVVGHLIRFVESERSIGRGRPRAVERPADVVQLHRARPGRLPNTEADIPGGWWQKRILELRTIAVPLVERLIE